jgi:hypothetical protein
VVTATLDRTRDSLHALAEHVLAAAQARAGAGIRLRYTPGGFETLVGLPDGRRIAVVGDDIVVRGPGGERAQGLTTVAAAAAFAGVEAGLPPGIYPAATPLNPDAPLAVDSDATALLADWFALADEALRHFAEQVTGEQPQPVLWPEHFDIGITIDAANYGASPGDQNLPEPYLYVGPHAGPPRQDEFWNAPFGAARRRTDIHTVDDAVAFFDVGREQIRTIG